MNKTMWRNKIQKILRDPKARVVGIAVMVIYYVVYLISIDHIFFQQGTFEVFVVENPITRMFVSRAPFVWEPVAAVTLWGLRVFIAPMNLLLGGMLAILVGVNIMVAVFGYRFRKMCRIDTRYGLLGILPSFLTGFACCAPTFLIALAPALGSFAVYFISLQPFLIPISIVLLVGVFLWSVKELPVG